MNNKVYKNDPNNDNSLSSSRVSSVIMEDDEHNLWLTIVGVVNKFNPKTDEVTRFFLQRKR